MNLVKNILVPVDFSDHSIRAYYYARDLAEQSQARLHLLNVFRAGFPEAEPEDRKERLIGLLNRNSGPTDSAKSCDTESMVHVVTGNPAWQIIRFACDNDIDLIVMGTHGRTGLARIALGSVAAQVLHQSPCPVTMLGPHDGENATLSNAVDVIEPWVGEVCFPDRESGVAALRELLITKLRVDESTANFIAEELEFRRWLVWEQGRWVTIEGNELAEEFQPLFRE